MKIFTGFSVFTISFFSFVYTEVFSLIKSHCFRAITKSVLVQKNHKICKQEEDEELLAFKVFCFVNHFVRWVVSKKDLTALCFSFIVFYYFLINQCGIIPIIFKKQLIDHLGALNIGLSNEKQC